MMQMNIERMINATGSLLIWLVMILAAVILAKIPKRLGEQSLST